MYKKSSEEVNKEAEELSAMINPATGKQFTPQEIADIFEAWGKIQYPDGKTFYNIPEYIDAMNTALKSYLEHYDDSANASANAPETTTGEETSISQFDKPGISDETGTPDYEGRKNATDVQQAIAEGAQTAQAESENNAVAAASAGVNKSRAGMLSDNASQQTQTNNVSNIASANSSQAASTQADYLNKMAQADALDQQAKNIKSGSAMTALGGGIQGAASGAIAGAIISDEDMKEPIDFDQQLYDAIRQFKELYKKVKAMRGRK